MVLLVLWLLLFFGWFGFFFLSLAYLGLGYCHCSMSLNVNVSMSMSMSMTVSVCVCVFRRGFTRVRNTQNAREWFGFAFNVNNKHRQWATHYILYNIFIFFHICFFYYLSLSVVLFLILFAWSCSVLVCLIRFFWACFALLSLALLFRFFVFVFFPVGELKWTNRCWKHRS